MNLKIREARIDDLAAIFDLETRAYNGFGATKEKIELRIRRYPQGFLVGENDGRVVGYINGGCFARVDLGNERIKFLEGHDPRGETTVVFSLVVEPQFRKQGIARRLLADYIERARRQRKRNLLLVCEDQLVGFYESAGFVCRGPSACTFGGHRWNEMALNLRRIRLEEFE